MKNLRRTIEDPELDRLMHMPEHVLREELLAHVLREELLAQGFNADEVNTRMVELMNQWMRRDAPYGKACLDPLACNLRGYCPLDPACGN